MLSLLHKILFLILFSLPVHSFGQNELDNFINEIIELDSLSKLKFYPKVAYLKKESIASFIDFAHMQEIDYAYYEILLDSTISKEEKEKAAQDHLNALLDSTTQTKFSDILSLWVKNSHEISTQIIENNRKKRHKLKKIKATSNIIKNVTKRSKGFYTLSNPIFIKKYEIAVIEINIVWGPLFGRGYLNIYKKGASGKWKKVSKIMTWMS